MKWIFFLLSIISFFSTNLALAQASTIMAANTQPATTAPTLSYSLDPILQALKTHDNEKFNQYIDAHKFIAALLDDEFDLAYEKEYFNSKIDSKTLAQDNELKYALTAVLEKAIPTCVETGDFSQQQGFAPLINELEKSIDLSFLEVKSISPILFKNDRSYVDILLLDKLLNKEFKLTLEIQPNENHTWKIIKMVNFKEYVHQCAQAQKIVLAEINKPTAAKINEEISLMPNIKTNIRYDSKFSSGPILNVQIPYSIHPTKELAYLLGNITVKNAAGTTLITSGFSSNLRNQKANFLALDFALDHLILGMNDIVADPHSLNITVNITHLHYSDGETIALRKDLLAQP